MQSSIALDGGGAGNSPLPTENNGEKPMEIMHFNSPKERMAYVKGEFEEITPIVAEIEPKVAEEKPKKAKKTAKKAKKED